MFCIVFLNNLHSPIVIIISYSELQYVNIHLYSANRHHLLLKNNYYYVFGVNLSVAVVAMSHDL